MCTFLLGEDKIFNSKVDLCTYVDDHFFRASTRLYWGIDLILITRSSNSSPGWLFYSVESFDYECPMCPMPVYFIEQSDWLWRINSRPEGSSIVYTPPLSGRVGFRKGKKPYNDLNYTPSVNIIFRNDLSYYRCVKKLNFNEKPPFWNNLFILPLKAVKGLYRYKHSAFVKGKAV